jgi:hypothetical protein
MHWHLVAAFVVLVNNTKASGYRVIILKAAKEMLPFREATTVHGVTSSTLWSMWNYQAMNISSSQKGVLKTVNLRV